MADKCREDGSGEVNEDAEDDRDCHPIREADMRSRGVIAADILAKLPDVSGAVFPTLDQLNAAKDLITKNWDSVVGANIQKAP